MAGDVRRGEPARTRAIRAVHAEARARAIDDDTRRAIQRAVVGVDSCADMSLEQIRRVLDALRGRRGHLSVAGDPADSSRNRMAAKVRALRDAGGLSSAYVDGICQRMYRRPLAACDTTQLHGVIAALDRHLKRHAAG